MKVIKSIILIWAGHVARMEKGRSSFNISRGKTTGKRPLGRPRCRWEDNIRKNVKGRGFSVKNWIDSAHDMHYWRALVNAVLKWFHKSCS